MIYHYTILIKEGFLIASVNCHFNTFGGYPPYTFSGCSEYQKMKFDIEGSGYCNKNYLAHKNKKIDLYAYSNICIWVAFACKAFQKNLYIKNVLMSCCS